MLTDTISIMERWNKDIKITWVIAAQTVIAQIISLLTARQVKTNTFPKEYSEIKEAKYPKYSDAPLNEDPKRR